MTEHAEAGFELLLSFQSDHPTVSVVGELDTVTSPGLAGMLEGMIDGGHRHLTVDLGELTFIDARGLRALASIATRSSRAGHALTLRSTPAFARRLLDLTQVSDLLLYDTAPPDPSSQVRRVTDPLGPDGETAASEVARSRQAMSRSGVDVIDAALRLVTALAAATVDNADGVSVTLERYGRLMTVAASNEAVMTMDRHQYETGEGPCLDARAEGRWFYIESLADETRWPTFVPLALRQGIHSILSSPLVTSDRTQGALNIYSSTPHAFGPHEQELAALFADRASDILTTAQHDIAEDESQERLAAALIARQSIQHAQGVLMALDGITADEAMSALFDQARAAGTTVRERAQHILASVRHDGLRHSTATTPPLD